MTVKISDLPVGANPTDPDLFPTVQGLNTVSVTFAQIVQQAALSLNVTPLPDINWSPPDTPAGDGEKLFNDTTGLLKGQPLLITQGGTMKRYIITDITDTPPTPPAGNVFVAGPQLTPAVAITQIATLNVGNTVQADLLMPGSYEFGGPAGDILDRTTRSPFFWHLPRAYLCYAQFSHDTPDTGTQPTVNVTLRGNDVFTSPVTMSGSSNTPVAVANGSADISEYVVDFGDQIEIKLDTAAGNLDAKDLTAALTFVFA